MSLSEGFEMVLLVMLILSLTANGAAVAVLVRDWQDRREALKGVTDERALLSDEMKKLAELNNNSVKRWQELSDRVVTLETKLVAIQTNLQASAAGTFGGFRK